MTRRFTVITLVLTAFVAFLIGAIVAGGAARASSSSARSSPAPVAATPTPSPLVNFAQVVERINAAVVNIDATSRLPDARRRRGRPAPPDSPDLFNDPFEFGGRGERDPTRRGAGSGFIVDADGSILTNHHV